MHEQHRFWMYEEGADKFLARPGRKQFTATKLGIYSTYSPSSSIHFLARCPNLFKALKKHSKGCPSNQVSATAMTSASDEKWRPFNCVFFFRFREQVVVRRGQIRRIGWVIKTLEAQVGQFLLGCKRLVSRGIVVQEQDHFGDLPEAVFLQNVLQLHQQRWIILRVDSLTLWKITEEDAVLIQKKNRMNLFCILMWGSQSWSIPKHFELARTLT